MKILLNGGGGGGYGPDKLTFKKVRVQKKKESLTGQSPSMMQQNIADMRL